MNVDMSQNTEHADANADGRPDSRSDQSRDTVRERRGIPGWLSIGHVARGCQEMGMGINAEDLMVP